MSKLLAIDPGNVKSGYVLINMDDYSIVEHGKIKNEVLEEKMRCMNYHELAIEMVASYGMRVGQSVFDTCVQIGRFEHLANNQGKPSERIYRNAVKHHLLGASAVKDQQITQYLVHRFTSDTERLKWGDFGKGKKDDKGFFYGFVGDTYQAYAVGVTYLDKLKEKENG